MELDEVRLIDANALKYKNLAEVNGKLTYVLTAEEINSALTVEVPNYAMGYQDGVRKVLKEVAEGKHRPQGEWITRHKQNSFGQDVVCFECNKCGEYKLPIIHTMITEPLGVCPNCGVNMRKGGTE